MVCLLIVTTFFNQKITFFSFPAKSDGQGSCLLYSNYDFSVFMCACCLVAKTVSLVFFIASAVASRRSNIPDITAEIDENKTVEVHINEVCEGDEDVSIRTRM